MIIFMETRWLIPILVLALSSGCVRVRLPQAHIVPGQSQEALTWERAVELALANHPDLLRSRAELASKIHNRNQAFGAYLPSIDGSASRTHPRSGNDSLTLDLDATQPIFTGFKTTGDFLKAKREWEAARFAYVEKSAEVRQALRTAFVELLRLYKRLEVDRKIAERRKENAELIQLRYEAGRENEGSWRRAQAIAEQAAFDVRQTERRIGTQSLVLGRQLGGHFAVPMPVVGELGALMPTAPEPPADYVTLAESTPSVKRLTRSAEALKAAILSAQSELLPTVNGTFNYGYSGINTADLDNEAATVGVKVTMPFFDGGRNVQGVLESNADYRAAVETARSARDFRIADLSDRWAAFRDAWEFVTVRRSFLDAARKRAEIVHAQYTTGLANFQDFDIAEQELADSEKSYVQSLADLLTKEAEWAAAKGEALEEVLNGK